MEIKELNQDRAIVKAISKKISSQVDDSPEYKLMFAVFNGALIDMFSMTHTIRDAACLYLSGDMPHLTAIGIDPDWVKRLFDKTDIDVMLTKDYTNMLHNYENL